MVVRSSRERVPVARGRSALPRRTRAGGSFTIPDFKSCTKFIAHVAEDTFRLSRIARPGGTRLLGGHHRWRPVSQRANRGGAEGAGDAADAGHRGDPRPQLIHRIIRLMQQKPLADVLNEPEVRSTFEGLYEAPFRIHRDHARSRNLHGRRDRVRRQRQESGRSQQVHSRTTCSRRRLLRRREPFAGARQGFGGNKPVDRGSASRIWRSSASSMAEAAMPSLPRFRSSRTNSKRRARLPREIAAKLQASLRRA